MNMYKKIVLNDKEVEEIINLELERQKDFVQLIASENYTSSDVLKASGSVLTNKYAEGYPGKRYYDGCENMDLIEQLAIERAKKIFNVEYVNVQPFSGTTANMSIYLALLNPGEKILGLDLSCGGHLSHGYRHTGSGKLYQGSTYFVDENGILDYDAIMEKALEEKPKIIVCGYSSYSQQINFEKFRKIADACGALLLADISHIAGLVIAGVHPSPSKYADVIMTTTHKTLRGPRGAIIMTNNPEIARKIDAAVFPGNQGGAAFHTIASKAVAFKEAATKEFRTYQEQVVKNSYEFCETFKKMGAKIISNGTQNHLFVIDVKSSYGLTGESASKICRNINIVTNKNTIPFDTERPIIGSGIRLGTPAMTSRGFTVKEFQKLAQIMHQAWSNPTDSSLHSKLQQEIKQLLVEFPIKNHYT